MKKVSLIMRVYNRLEYTIETLSNIITNTTYDNYEIIIINNNSQDGTTEWLDWVQENSPVYTNKFKHIKLGNNIGDWYGMVEGLKYISEDSEYIVQVDNDITMTDGEWLNKMVHVIEETKAKSVMLKRVGVMNILASSKNRTIEYNGQQLQIGNVNRPVCCYIIRKDDFINFTNKNNKITGNQSKHMLGSHFKDIIKILNVESKVHLNNTKYMFNNKNVWEFI